MATLTSLKHALRQGVPPTASTPKQLLSDTQYSAGFDLLVRSGWTTYQDFIIPQLSQLLTSLTHSCGHVSVLEIGPGPKSVLAHLPNDQRRRIRTYTAFEPNVLFATKLEAWLSPATESKMDDPLPGLRRPADIRRAPMTLDSKFENGHGTIDDKFDLILFCHSMYGLKPKRKFLERALELLSEGGMVAVFHRDTLYLNELVCHRTASFPTGLVRVPDDDQTLDCFAAFIVGFVSQDMDLRTEWRTLCRALGRREEGHPAQLLFSAPEVMVAFTRHATALPELLAAVPVMEGYKTVKNREARLKCPAAVVRPVEVGHIQECVRWALKHGTGLTVVGGGHSGHCLMSNIVAVNMGALKEVHILRTVADGALVVAEAGCTTGDIVRKAKAAGLTVPLGARPSVGAGLWLQGGIGHLARQHGLACDAVVGAVVVSVASGEVLCVGHVPSQHRPPGAVRPDNEADLLWAIKGAGTNFGIVASVAFKAYPAQTFSVRNWLMPLTDKHKARLLLTDFDELVARELPRNCSADAYLYSTAGQMHLGVTLFESSTTGSVVATQTAASALVRTVFARQEDNFRFVDEVGLFDAELYMSGMHGGHGGGKTSSFKRCVFLKCISEAKIAHVLFRAVEARPSPLCYLHLLHGGGTGAVADVAAHATAFGCRDWDFACVITGVWPRDQDDTEAAGAAVRWVYAVVRDLLPLSSGTYGADLGPDPRDAALAATAFGPNRARLTHLKHTMDPRNVLAFASPLPKAPMESKLIIIVTGEHGAGKDYFANVCVSVLSRCTDRRLTVRAVSISDALKRKYAAEGYADLNRLLCDRDYKEQHRTALRAFFEDKLRERPGLPEEHFLDVVYGAADVDVLLITGMTDETPVASLSHLVPDSKMIEVRIQASEETRRARRGCYVNDDHGDTNNGRMGMGYRPSLVFHNDTTGNEAAERFAIHHLLPFLHDDLQRLADLVRAVPDFPRPGIEFRHILGVAEQPEGLALCTSLLQAHFIGDWSQVGVVVCCEAGGFVFASALASRVVVPLALIREAGKLPPPTVSVVKCQSHISASTSSHEPTAERIEMGRDAVPRDAKVVVVDDVLATGKTLCAVLQLLGEAGVDADCISVIVVAEFPVHRGRELLRQHGYGGVDVRSLLVFGGA
ncbi:adenine phosphoribosyltransferase [Coniochaeta sp. PMI_546]|nr:adenine phosphoribosyltransferase [Coniochaeta sp. PMI_546]